MRAALVRDFGSAPQLAEVPEPDGSAERSVFSVRAAGVHPLVRSRAAGEHYSADASLPFVPGVDAVVSDDAGALFYVMTAASGTGTMAERIAVAQPERYPVPAGADPVAIAAGVNPTMASWLALRRRIDFQPGQSVAVLGASGSSGRAALQVAKHLGAREVYALGRDASRLGGLADLGADHVLSYDDADQASNVDVVLDLVWGPIAERLIPAMMAARPDKGRTLTWVQTGSLAGPTATLGAAPLRSGKLALVGSGIGAITGQEFAEELPNIIAVLADAAVSVGYRTAPLAEVEKLWNEALEGGARLVFTP